MGSAEYLLILGLVLLGAAVYNIVTVVLGSSQSADLVWASEEEPEKSKNGFIEFSRPLAHFTSMGLAKKVKSLTYREKVNKQIKVAGLSRVINVDEFIGIQVFWGFFFPLISLIINFTFELGFSPLLILGLSAFGIYVPKMYAEQTKAARYKSVILDLPFFIDLLALATEAGLEFINAIQQVVDKAGKDSVLASEFDLVLRDIKLGRSRQEAMRDMAARLDISEITSFVAVIIDSSETGVSIGKVLQQQSEQMRLERFSRAEKEGAKASQMMLIPMMVFIMPAVFIMVFGPVVLQFLGQGN
ncbi:MAG: type II secretion system F family protein [Bdellovibrionales bacterium]